MPITNHQSPITLWLTLCAALVVAMVLVGGYTRLSGSGLSITEWKPIHGTIPPKNDTEWQEEFTKYQQIPQYTEINKGMTLDEFKTIFWPEYWHRLLGRLIGLVFFLPLVLFWASGRITNRFGVRLLGIFALGGVQGLMGWYMVSSGLIHNVYVSHLRLAAHFSLALLLLALLIWAILDMTPKTRPTAHRPLSTSYRLWFTLLCLQILYGALMAGLHAGLMYNTWPDMNGDIAPEGLWALNPGWINLFENHATVQFIHRWLAAIVAMGFGFWWFSMRSYVTHRGLTRLAACIAIIIALQFFLGVLTLVKAVPLGIALKHQMMAVLLFGLSVVMLHRLGRRD